ncbi:MAG: hypothetical protein ACXVZJ_08890, partial [Terriglobales bacterium]
LGAAVLTEQFHGEGAVLVEQAVEFLAIHGSRFPFQLPQETRFQSFKVSRFAFRVSRKNWAV